MASENGQRLLEAAVEFDLCFSSSMVRTMETAYYMFCKTGLISKIFVAPYISEIPLEWSKIPIYENLPVRRAKQIEKLGKCHGSGILDSISWEMVGGPTGSNEHTMPPSALDHGQRFFHWLYSNPLIQEMLKTKPKLRVGVVTHSNLLKEILELGAKPANADIWVANLHVMPGGKPEDPPILTLADLHPWFQEQVALKQEVIAHKIVKTDHRVQKKIFKYETKLYKLRNGVVEEGDEEKHAKKEAKYVAKLEKKEKKYAKKLEKLKALQREHLNESDVAASLHAAAGEEMENGELSASSDSD